MSSGVMGRKVTRGSKAVHLFHEIFKTVQWNGASRLSRNAPRPFYPLGGKTPWSAMQK